MPQKKEPKDSKENIELRDKKLIKNLEFLYKLYTDEIYLVNSDLKLLEKHGYINKKKKESLPKKPTDTRKAVHTDVTKTDKEKEADESVDIILDNEMYEDDVDVEFLDTKVYSSMQDEKLFLYSGSKKKISKEDWKPKDLIYHKNEFVDWIDSINSGFQKMISYRPFQMYCQQSKDWMADKENIYEYDSIDQRREFAWTEMDRIRENSLYFLDKYLHVKEASYQDGFMDYESKPVHKVMAFLFDCGYSVEIGKARQIAATTTIGGLGVCKLISTKNYFIKMIAQDKEKVQEIFDDKIKYPFAALPDWLHQNVLNDRDNLLSLGRKTQKGKRGGVNSKFQVVAPTVAAINGGAPPLVLIDEGGYINILGKMIKEARPTMFLQDPITKRIAPKRQIWIWATAGDLDRKGKAFAEEYQSTLDKWADRDFEYGIIPLFFDWTTRPGVTREHYLKEKRAYSVKGPEAEEKMVQFRQAYPSIIEDMFLTSSKTLVPISFINKQLEKIRDLEHHQRAEWGYFEPMFDMTKPSREHDDLPYELIGASFVTCQKNDPRASAQLFMRPEKGWVDRYYLGTDPIAVDNGYSNMATSVWDAQFNTLAAIVNYRSPNHKETFLQNLCLSLYYDIDRVGKDKKGMKNLVEGNIGTAFTDYVEFKGFRNSLVLRTELPSSFQGGQAEIGIDNRASRTRFIIHKLHELITLYGDKIFIEAFWIQLSTFVCKITDKGNETWETHDRRKYHDDVLFSTVFSYICSVSFDHRPPRNMERKEDLVTTRWETYRDGEGSLRRRPVIKRVA